jgi:hypothetical protein
LHNDIRVLIAPAAVASPPGSQYQRSALVIPANLPYIWTSALFARTVLGQIRDTFASGTSDEKYYVPQRADRRSQPE